MARKLIWLDRPGDGSRLKLVLNSWILCTVENLAESLALARALGFDERRFFGGIGARRRAVGKPPGRSRAPERVDSMAPVGFDPSTDYPLGSRRPDLVCTPAGTPLAEVTLEALRAGRIGGEELRVTAETLRRQADVARAAGRDSLADNLARAAELTAVPDDVILDLYTALRPRRSSAAELDGWADRLERTYDAPLVAAFVRDAAAVYEERGLLRTQREHAGAAAV